MNTCSCEVLNCVFFSRISDEACLTQRMSDLDLGEQPLIMMMEKWGLSNEDLVKASTEQLTFKQVQKARKGRRLTMAMMFKVMRAYNVAIWHKLDKKQKEKFTEYNHRPLFNYAKGYDAEWADPNEALIAELAGDGEE